MDSELEARVIAALDLDEAQRDAAIAALCAAHPAAADDVRGLADAAAVRSKLSGSSLAAAFVELRALPFAKIGAYRLLSRLGEGAHGEVFLAEQSEPIFRRVALKLLRDRIDRTELVARFEAERQALALLDHPNIARIVDAGTTDDGRPWFAMEAIGAATSITRFCDEERLSLHDRLGLFATACDAIQHAHGRGILHRDLKPSNVLCTRVDGRPVAKVIDFGIAKTIGARLTGAPFQTVSASPLGTPLYASPEQVRGALDVDVRTDVYSLGALLHELCCGEQPFAEHDLARAWSQDRAEFFDIVTRRDPEPPSRRLVNSPDAPTTSGVTRGQLARACRGDIDSIVIRALARTREARYPTVSELSADVRCVLAGRPVAARASNLVERTSRALRRHRAAFAIGILAVLGLAIALRQSLASNAALRRAERQLADQHEVLRGTIDELELQRAQLTAANDERAAQQQRAEDGHALALARADSLAASTARLRLELREAEEVRRLLRHAAASLPDATRTALRELIERLVAPLGGTTPVWTPGVESALRQTIAWLQIGLDDRAGAREQLERALALHTESDQETQLDRAAILHVLADDALAPTDRARAVAHLAEAAAIFERELGPDAPETLMAVGDHAFLRSQLGGFEAVLALSAFADIGRRLLLEDGASLSFEVAGQRLFALRDDLVTRLAAGDFVGARTRIDEILEPVLERPMLRARLANVLWAAAQNDQLQTLRPLLLETAVVHGTNDHGPGHDHVVLARRALLIDALGRLSAPLSIETLARYAAHAAVQARIDRTVPWSPLGGAIEPTSFLGILRAIAQARDSAALDIDALLSAARHVVGVVDVDLAFLRAELQR